MQEFVQPNLPAIALENRRRCPSCGYPDPEHPGWTKTRDIVDPERDSG